MFLYKLSANQGTCENLIDSHAWLQSSHACKCMVVELTYLHVVVKCESLLCGQFKAHCIVKEDTFNLTVFGEVILVTRQY